MSIQRTEIEKCNTLAELFEIWIKEHASQNYGVDTSLLPLSTKLYSVKHTAASLYIRNNDPRLRKVRNQLGGMDIVLRCQQENNKYNKHLLLTRSVCKYILIFQEIVGGN